MKKIISAILAIMMIAMLSISAFAAKQEFYVSDLELTATVLDEYDVFTRDMTDNSAFAEKVGVTEDYLESYAISNNIYFNALEKQWTDEIYIVMTNLTDPELTGKNFNNLVYSEVEYIYSNMKTAVEGNGGTLSSYERCTIGQTEYMKVYRNYAMDDIYDLVFYTIVNDKEYYFTLSSYLGEVTAVQEEMLIQFVNNIKYDYYLAPVVTEPVIEETEPEYYYEEETYYEDDNDTVGTDTERTGLDAKIASVLGAMGLGGIIIAAVLIGLPILFFIFIIILIIIIVVAVKKKKKKKAMEAANAENVAVAENVVIAENPAVAETEAEATENDIKTE